MYIAVIEKCLSITWVLGVWHLVIALFSKSSSQALRKWTMDAIALKMTVTAILAIHRMEAINAV